MTSRDWVLDTNVLISGDKDLLQAHGPAGLRILSPTQALAQFTGP